MRSEFYKKILLLALFFRTDVMADAQCVSINHLPDTIIACKNTVVPLGTGVTITSPGLLNPTDTTWTPPVDLSDPNIIDPVATVGTSSISYKLTIEALTPFNFVNNGNFSSGNTGFTSGYVLGTGGTWGQLSNEGTYAVTTNPANVHTNFASFGDHTTGTGQMMVVNGAATANVDIWCQTITVQPNTTYDFSAWSATCVTSNPAILQFAINGTLLGAPHALPATTGTWTQFHAVWFSGSNTSATICITNQNTQPSGNDFAIDDIEFREFCYTEDSVYIRVINLMPTIQYSKHLGCQSDTIRFQAIDNADVADQYIWDFGDGSGSTQQNPEHIYTTQGVYNVKLITQKDGCIDSAFTTISTVHSLNIDFTVTDDSICIGQDITFTSTSTATLGLNYFWDFGDGFTSSVMIPTHTYNKAGIYRVMHVVNDGVPCYDTMYMEIVVQAVPYASISVSDTTVCIGETILFESEVAGGYTDITWEFDDQTEAVENVFRLNHSYDRAGNYTVIFTATYPLCSDAVKMQNIRVFPTPKVDIGRDTTLCPHSAEPVILSNLQPNPTHDTYLWNTGSTHSHIRVSHPGIYALTVTNENGCSASDSLEVFKDCYIDIPNVFTPNGDGSNDYFLPRQLLSRSVTKFRMQLFNRWGQMVFETNSTNGRGWDGKFNGKDQPTGVYIYLIEVELNSVFTEKYQGNVSLIR